MQPSRGHWSKATKVVTSSPKATTEDICPLNRPYPTTLSQANPWECDDRCVTKIRQIDTILCA